MLTLDELDESHTVDITDPLSATMLDFSNSNRLLRDITFDDINYAAFNVSKAHLFCNNEQFSVKCIPGHFWGSKNKLGPYRKFLPDSKKIMLIGEYPGLQETMYGRNFVGASGRFLYEVLRKVGFSSKDIGNMYVCNICRWQKPAGVIHVPKNWIQAGLLFTYFEMIRLEPEVVICMGLHAIKALLGKSYNIKNTFGRLMTIEFKVNLNNSIETRRIPALGCNNPAGILRNSGNAEQFVSVFAHLKELTSEKKQSYSRSYKVDYEVVDTNEKLKAFCDKIKAKKGLKKVAVDCEWQGFFPKLPNAFLRTIQICYDESLNAVIVVSDKEGKPVIHEEDLSDQLNALLKRKDVQIIGNFFSSDMPWLESVGINLYDIKAVPDDFDKFYGGNYPGLFDIALAHHAYDETADFALETSAVCLANTLSWSRDIELWKKDYCTREKISSKDFPGYGEVPDEILYPYAASDAYWTRKLADIHCKKLYSDKNGQDCWRPFYISMRAFPAYADIHRNGIKVDVKTVMKLADSYMDRYCQELEELRSLLKWPTFNPDSYLQCSYALFGVDYVPFRPGYGLSGNNKPIKATGKEGIWKEEWKRIKVPSSDIETCSILATDSEIARSLRIIKLLGQLFRNVLPNKGKQQGILAWLCSDGRVHSTFMQVKETGRSSSSRPPLQNYSKKREPDYKQIMGANYFRPLRSIFIPEKDHILLEADLVSAELFTLGVLANDKLLIEHCLRNSLPEESKDHYDIHSNLAVKVFNLGCEPTKTGMKNADKLNLRIATKSIVYGTLYARGVESCRREIAQEGIFIEPYNISRIIDEFFSTYHRSYDFLEEAANAAISPGWLRTPFGRCRRFALNVDDKQLVEAAKREARNFLMQGTVADAINILLYKLREHPSIQKLGYKFVLQQHDAILLEIPQEHIDELMKDVIPYCVKQITICPSDILGNRTSDDNYYFGIDQTTFNFWGYDDGSNLALIIPGGVANG